jgi:hypothetical protein
MEGIVIVYELQVVASLDTLITAVPLGVPVQTSWTDNRSALLISIVEDVSTDVPVIVPALITVSTMVRILVTS